MVLGFTRRERERQRTEQSLQSVCRHSLRLLNTLPCLTEGYLILLDAFKRYCALSCSKSIMKMWNYKQWSFQLWGFQYSGFGMRRAAYKPDSVPRLIPDSCVTWGSVSLRFSFEEPFSTAVHTKQDCLCAHSTSSVC